LYNKQNNTNRQTDRQTDTGTVDITRIQTRSAQLTG